MQGTEADGKISDTTLKLAGSHAAANSATMGTRVQEALWNLDNRSNE